MRRVLATTVFILLAALTGCSGDEPTSEEPHGETSPNPIDEGDEPVQPVVPCAEECSNMEVAESDCDTGKEKTVGKLVEVDPATVDGVAGVLELRMADPAVCESIYWARFRPYATASANWVVTIRVTDRPFEDQKSDQGPNVDGWTEGVYAAPGADIEYCVTQATGDGDDKICESAHINQGDG